MISRVLCRVNRLLEEAAATRPVLGLDTSTSIASLALIAGGKVAAAIERPVTSHGAALPGAIVSPGQTILTLIDPDNLWVRVDVEETYIDRVRIGDKMTVRLPSGDEREGVVYYRGSDASFATQRDVSRTKRDIKTFEIRLRVDNRDRRLAVGMTAYVLLPVS